MPDEMEVIARCSKGRAQERKLIVQAHRLIVRPCRGLAGPIQIYRDDPEPICQAFHQRSPLSGSTRTRMNADNCCTGPCLAKVWLQRRHRHGANAGREKSIVECKVAWFVHKFLKPLEAVPR